MMMMLIDMVIFRAFVFIKAFIWHTYKNAWTFLPYTLNITVTFPFHKVKSATELDKITEYVPNLFTSKDAQDQSLYQHSGHSYRTQHE